MKLFFHFRKAQTDPSYDDEHDPLDAVVPIQAPAVQEDRETFSERVRSYIPLFSELFRHKRKQALWPY